MGRLIDADVLWMDVIHSVDYCDDILEFIERQPTTEQWIPCSERLPEENMWTICQNNAGAMMIGEYDIEFGWIFPAYFDGIVAWMPLPEPYTEETK